MYPTDVPLHCPNPEDLVLLKTWKSKHPEDQLQPCWVGPSVVLLTTHSSVTLKGVKPWIHHNQMKLVPQESTGLLNPVSKENIKKNLAQISEPRMDLKLFRRAGPKKTINT